MEIWIKMYLTSSFSSKVTKKIQNEKEDWHGMKIQNFNGIGSSYYETDLQFYDHTAVK